MSDLGWSLIRAIDERDAALKRLAVAERERDAVAFMRVAKRGGDWVAHVGGSANVDAPSWRSLVWCVFSVAGPRTPHHGLPRGLPGDGTQITKMRQFTKMTHCVGIRVWIAGRPGAIHAVGSWKCEGLYEVGP